MRKGQKLFPWTRPPMADEPIAIVLSPQQGRILAGMCLGLGDAEIAAGLELAQDTVKAHAKVIREALGVHNRTHAVAKAMSPRVAIFVTGDPSGTDCTGRASA